MILIENAAWIIGIPIIFIILMFMMRHAYVKARKGLTEGEKKSQKVKYGAYLIRFVMFSLLLVGLAAPYTSTTTEIQEDAIVRVLVDESASMSKYNFNKDSLLAALSSFDNVQVVTTGKDQVSPLGNALLSTMTGNDNILLVSDGNTNKGADLGQAISLATTLNTTVNAITIKEKKADASVSINGPRLILAGLPAQLVVEADSIGDQQYEVIVTLDGQEIKRFSGSEKTREPITIQTTSGFHKLVAKIAQSDANEVNNIYYKSIHALDKPSILFVTDEYQPMQTLLEQNYDLEVRPDIPQNLNKYHGIVFNNQHAGKLEPRLGDLSNYVLDGNGLLFTGGTNAFEKGNYDNSVINTLLPTKVGAAKPENITDLNVVILIDISVSSGLDAGGQSVVDIAKAQSINILRQLKQDDYLGVIAFNKEPHIVVPLLRMKENGIAASKIGQLQSSGGTYIDNALRATEQMLDNVPGNKHVVLISDGKTKNPEVVISLTRQMHKKGITLHTVGVGPGTDDPYLEGLSFVGGGVSLHSGSENQLGLIFGDVRSEVTAEKSLRVIDQGHFITNGLDLQSTVTGFNQVVPKESAQLLVGTNNGVPILTTWRFGLGRVGSLSTDGGKAWAGKIYSDDSKLITKTTNWVAGDPRRRENQQITITDGRVDEALQFTIRSDTTPQLEGFSLSEVDDGVYIGSTNPTETGFFNILNEEFAVNYAREYEDLSINEELEQLIKISGGEYLETSDAARIIEKIRQDSIRVVEDREYYREYILGTVIILFLLEIFSRRKKKNQNN